jgi:hypothetical protein
MRRALILLAITALACRDKDAPKPSPQAAPAAPPPPAAPVAVGSTPSAAPERPVLPAAGSGSGLGSGTIADQFAADPIDSMWKSRTEGDLKRAFAKMKHPPKEAECHTTLCRLTIGGSEAELEASVDELQALREQAQSLLLTAPVKDGDGRMKLVAYLQYERPNP